MNPFKYGTIVSGKDFCGRKTLLKQLIGHVESSQRIALLGERRVGKSSTVYEAILKCKKERLLYVDLLGIKSIDAFCRRILRAIVVLEQKTGWFDKIIKTLSYLRPSISVDPITSIAKEGGKRVFSVAFMKSAGFNNPSSVRRAITRLIKLNILFESGGEYRFINPFFRAWLPYKG